MPVRGWHEGAEGGQRHRRGGGHGETGAGARGTGDVIDSRRDRQYDVSKHKLIREEKRKEKGKKR